MPVCSHCWSSFTGLSDIPGEAMVKLYCPKCMDVYTPKSSRHHHTDGAYFGTGFPHMLFMVHPEYRPKRPANQFVPRLVRFNKHTFCCWSFKTVTAWVQKLMQPVIFKPAPAVPCCHIGTKPPSLLICRFSPLIIRIDQMKVAQCHIHVWLHTTCLHHSYLSDRSVVG